jgi:T5SS/PEP-CTERM-associated repeat protein
MIPYALISRMIKTSAGALLALLPVCVASAKISGAGTETDPYVIDSSNYTDFYSDEDSLYLLDGGNTYYQLGSDVNFGSTINLYVGRNNADNFLTIDDGYDMNNYYGYIGVGVFGPGTVTVTGSGSAWINSGDLCVGKAGNGTLQVENGGSVSCSSGVIAWAATSTSTATITGAGSTWTTSNLFVALSGTGALNIENGGSVSSEHGTYIGRYNGSSGTVTITGSGSLLADNAASIVGDYYGTGTIIIEAGGCFSTTQATIGWETGSTGTVIVTGLGSTMIDSGYLKVGDAGAGTLTISDNALVTVAGSAILDTTISTGTNGTIYLADGYLAIKGELTASTAASSYNIKVCDGSSWVAATADNLTATYYDGTTDVWSASDLYATYGSKIDLTGYTVITGGVSSLTWAGAEVTGDNWYGSTWYGWFYADPTWGNWVYQEDHGYQYVYGFDDGTAYIYDNALQDWWFTSSTYYPYIYDYSTASWYFYISGTTPSRTFWSYSANKTVSENTGF